MTEQKKQELLKELERYWENASTLPEKDFGGMLSIITTRAQYLAASSKLTKQEAAEVYSQAQKFEQDFRSLTENDTPFGRRKKHQLETYLQREGLLPPFEDWWSERVERDKPFFT